VAALPRTDPYLENPQNAAHIDILWLANLVDIFNTAMTDIEAELAAIDVRLTNGGL
jgi:hypothetical protein